MLEPLIISKTKLTPEVILDTKKKIFKLEGDLLPENSLSFFEPILDWFKKYVDEAEEETILNLSFDIINTSSTRRLISLMRILEKIVDKGKKVKVVFLFMPEDEIMEYMIYEIANAFPSITFESLTK